MFLARIRPKRVLALVLALPLVLAGCGTDSESQSGKQGLDQVRMLFPTIAASYGDVIVGSRTGIFEKHGIDVEILPNVTNSTAQVQAVMSGDADLTGTAASSLFAATANGRDVVALAPTADTMASLVVATTAWIEEQAKKGVTVDSTPEEKVKALEGATMGVAARGTGTETFYEALFAYYEVKYGESTFVGLGDPRGLDAGLRSRQVDTIFTSMPQGLLPEKEGYGAVWLDGTDYAQLPPWKYGNQAYLASRKWVEENPDVAKRFVDAINEAREFIRKDPQASADAFLKQAADNDPELTFKAFEVLAGLYRSDAVLSRGYFEQNKKFYDTEAEKPSTLTYEEGVWEGVRE